MKLAETNELQSVTRIDQVRKALGQSIWMLLLLRGWRGPSDSFVRSGGSILARELGKHLGIGERQARRDLQRLRTAGFVEVQNTGRGHRIRLRAEDLY